MIQLVVIRHAQTAWNIGEGQADRFRGAVDLPLSEAGIEQARATADRLAGWPLAAVYTSPLRRAADMARLIAHGHGLVPEALADLSALDYGDWVGRTHAEVQSVWPELYEAWRQDPFSIAIPGGEGHALLRRRLQRAVDQIRARHRSGETVALVSHQAITRTLTCELLGLPGAAYWRVWNALCGLNLFELDPAGPALSLRRLNDARHLGRSFASGPLACRILLLRHGQTAWNAPAAVAGPGPGPERFRGRADVPLSDQGHRQARALAEHLVGEPVAAIYASPLQRTQQTVRPLAEALGLRIEILEGLLDLDYGELSGLTHAEAAARAPQLYAAWQATPGRVTFPGGESLSAVRARALQAVEWAATRHPRETVVLVGHQIVNKVVLCALLGLDDDNIWRVGQDTGTINVLQRQREGWQVRALNLGLDDPPAIRAR